MYTKINNEYSSSENRHNYNSKQRNPNFLNIQCPPWPSCPGELSMFTIEVSTFLVVVSKLFLVPQYSFALDVNSSIEFRFVVVCVDLLFYVESHLCSEFLLCT